MHALKLSKEPTCADSLDHSARCRYGPFMLETSSKMSMVEQKLRGISETIRIGLHCLKEDGNVRYVAAV